MANTIHITSEFMQNYVQAEIMSPQSKFEALQTSTGLSLLFSTGTDNVFYVTEEAQGASASGWQKLDLSSAQIAKDFAGKSGMFCKTFDVAQNITDGTIGMAMAISDGTNDHLYLCLGNSNSDTSWLANPQWVYYPYDAAAPSPPPSPVQIVNIFISETTQGQYILVDIVQDLASANQLVSRYYIHTANAGGTAWNVHSITIDLQTTGYQSCLGRQAGQTIDGVYTAGNINGSPQFIYQPLYNIWNPALPANPARLALPQNLQPDAIASCRNADQSTDLYCAAGSGLYYFASTNQQDQAMGALLFNNSLLTGVTHVFAASNSTTIVVWGLNQANQVFYTTCPLAQAGTGSAWSTPLPVLSQVDLISPYLNVADGGNTFFGVGGNFLYKMIKSPVSGLWTTQQITLPAPGPQSPAQSFSSYTTRIQLVDDTNTAVPQATLMLSAKTRATFYINNLYYVLDTNPIPVETDAQGFIILIETVDDITGTQIQVAAQNGTPTNINPMEKPFNQATQLNTVSSLQSAVVTNPDGSTYPLVPSGNSQSDLQAAATSLGNLSQAYTSLSSPGQGNPSAMVMIAMPSPVSLAGAIETDIGDLFSWLESGVESIVQVLKDDATDAWNFVVKIADTVYHAVLDAVEKVVGALKWIFNAIKTAIEDLIKFLEFLFEWADITRTKEVFKNLVTSFLQYEVDQISVYQQGINTGIQNLVAAINGWADITDWSGLGTAGTSSVSASSSASLGQSSPGTLLSHHFQYNANNLTLTNPPAPPIPGQSYIDILIQAIQNEGTLLDATIDQLEKLASNYKSMSLVDILKQIIALLADTVLESVENILDALLDVIQQVSQTILNILDTPIYIPVVSDILSAFGVHSVSFIDLFCWITAVPVTIAYKIAEGAVPFLDNTETTYLINTTDFSSLMSAFSGTATTPPAASNPVNAMETTSLATVDFAAVNTSTSPVSMSQDTKNAVFVMLHGGSGFFTFMSCFITSFEAASETGDNPFSTPSAILGVLSAGTNGIANFLVPQDAIQNSAVSWISNFTTGVTILSKIIFSGPAQRKFAASASTMKYLSVNDGRSTGAIINSVLIIPALFCTCWHFYELSQDTSGDVRSNAIIGETSNMTGYISRISYTVAVNDEDPDSKAIAIGIMAVASICTGGLQTAEAIIGV
ncbi:hypothetical protein [Pedobacter sp. MR22-3]|uniref:hypothetical protein n=1 Tax=Pedobacter sp. MR22-3 TaxID=2994552 RepID=UPI002247537D|nr:hypothetical protein [Pedobacter sp. MR22-3]MCX2585609.1 hypothetical protein [Pedobacter sp. MR22-3]